MIRKYVYCVLALFLLITTTSAALAEYSYSTGYYYVVWSSTEKTCWITDCSSSVSNSTILRIPQTVAGYTVIGISGGSFLSGNTTIREVIFPPTLKSMGSGAFRDCKNLKTVTFTGPEIELSKSCFEGCTALEYVYGTENIKVFKWGNDVFKNCTSLKHFVIPSSLSYYYEDSNWFQGCTSLTLELQNGMTKICDNFLTGSTGIKEIVIPTSVTKIGMNSLSNMKNTTIRAKGYVSSIGLNSLLKCKKLYVRSGTELLNYCQRNRINYAIINSNPFVLPSMITTISEEAFMGLPVEEITLGNGVKSIGARAFANCKDLILLNLPSGVQIEEDAFDGCNQLTVICTPNSTGYTYAKENGIPVILR